MSKFITKVYPINDFRTETTTIRDTAIAIALRIQHYSVQNVKPNILLYLEECLTEAVEQQIPYIRILLDTGVYVRCDIVQELKYYDDENSELFPTKTIHFVETQMSDVTKALCELHEMLNPVGIGASYPKATEYLFNNDIVHALAKEFETIEFEYDYGVFVRCSFKYDNLLQRKVFQLESICGSYPQNDNLIDFANTIALHSWINGSHNVSVQDVVDAVNNAISSKEEYIILSHRRYDLPDRSWRKNDIMEIYGNTVLYNPEQGELVDSEEHSNWFGDRYMTLNTYTTQTPPPVWYKDYNEELLKTKQQFAVDIDGKELLYHVSSPCYAIDATVRELMSAMTNCSVDYDNCRVKYEDGCKTVRILPYNTTHIN